MIIDPLGDYIVEPYETTGIKTAEINIEQVKDVREQMNIYNDRRADLY